ncbi:MAG TPA: TetR/AcrR family transcriptional regulator [Xanthobacteraceae bacterium]|nr:TetR/AcrR family transcriptional regulator [Xanthobacteraceae bacterium]
MTDQSSSPQQSGTVQRDAIVSAFMALLAEKRIEDIGFAEIARRAGVSLSALRVKYSSKIEILTAHMREVDRAVLDGIDPGMADEPPRERLFDVLMRRLDLLAQDKAAVESLQRSVMLNPGLALALNGLTVRSMQWMLTAADISASGPKGMVRAQGLALLFASMLRTWVHDHDPGQARTLAALDRALSSGQRWAGLLDDLFRIPEAACNAQRAFGRRRRGEDRDRSGESAAA